LNKTQLNEFIKKKHYGFPLLLPLGIKYFDYNKDCIFKVEEKKILNKIFKTKKKNYIGVKIFFQFGNKFAYNIKIKKKYLILLNEINNINKSLIYKIKKIKKEYYVSSFQTRNVPHLGHEEIIKRLIKKKGKVIINPLIGMKKKGDFKNEILFKIFKNLTSNKEYKNNVYFKPMIANMHYAGPREAIHHINLREMVGFNRFTVGRDHAGAENNYKPLDAYKAVVKNKKKFNIDIFLHKGSYFCNVCKKIILKSDCNHKNLTEISGSQFRANLLAKKYFEYARRSVQNYIYKLNNKLYY
jgi:sulfate adenylyltransferase